MPHIDIKCYPKHLSAEELDDFIGDLTLIVQDHLKAKFGDISINYTEIPAERWKDEVWDTEIAPNLEHLAKQPGYKM
jgi:4-oxalocrotonate tautomerase